MYLTLYIVVESVVRTLEYTVFSELRENGRISGVVAKLLQI